MRVPIWTKLMRKARRNAFDSGHLLTKFARGKDSDGQPDQLTYGASCRFCGMSIVVLLYEPGKYSSNNADMNDNRVIEWKIISGLATKCHQGDRK